MKINQFTIILFFAFFFSKVNAQEFKLGKVSIAELQEKAHPSDSSAVAAILFKTGECISDYSGTTTKVRTRIKIYKKEGFNWANEGVLYNIGVNVFYYDAYTYNLVDGKIEKTKLQSEGEFTEKVNKYLSRKKIVMPNVKVGSVIEFEYIIRSGGYDTPQEWFFQTTIPVNHSKFTTVFSDYLVYKTNQKGFIFPKITRVKNANMDINTTYLLENIPAIKEEAFVNNIDNYTSSISHELESITVPGRIYKYFSTDWEAVTKTIYEDSSFGTELNKTGYFEDDINKLLVGLNTQNEKISAIFNFVKSKVKWNEYHGYSCDDGVKKAYKDKTGNTAEINLMLTAMLRYARIGANPVLLSTRSNGITFLPSTEAFNYVIAAVEIQDGLILLDATEKYSLPDVLPLEDLNWFGRLIREDGTSTDVNLMPKTLSREAANLSIIIKNDGSADGKIRRQLTDHQALEFRKENLATNKDTYLEELENKNSNIEISDYLRENDLDLSKPILESYSFRDTKDIEIINDKIYISPMLFLATKENPFKQEVREYPVDFGYPFQNKYNINIEIPEGYVVESMPEPINIVTGENVGAFKFVIVNTDNKIQVAITSTINTAIVASDFYPVLKAYYQQMIDKQNEKIVLKKM